MHAPSRRPCGITLLECVTSLAIVATLAAILLQRLNVCEELAEKTMVDITISHIRDGIRHELIRGLLGGKQLSTGSLIERNPIGWLGEPPASYMGEVARLPATAARGSWYFLNTQHELVYLPRQSAHLTVAGDEPVRLRWRLRPAGDRGIAALEQVRIEAWPPFVWF